MYKISISIFITTVLFSNIIAQTAKDFNFKFKDIKSKLVTIMEKNKGGGSGFIAKEKDTIYVYTNQHVILGAQTFEIKTISGQKFKPVVIELSKKRDIARITIKAENLDAFTFSDTSNMNEKIAVYGNSGAQEVATEIFGKVVGIGEDKIEISADVIPGNSGSPVLNSKGEVIAIISYATRKRKEDPFTKSTRFEEPRKFAYKISDDIKWIKVKWASYAVLGKKLQESKDFANGFVYIVNSWIKTPMNKMKVEKKSNRYIKKWAVDYNLMINKIDKMRKKGRATSSQLYRINEAFHKSQLKSAEALSKLCKKNAKNLRTMARPPYITEYLRKNMLSLAKQYDYYSKEALAIGDKMSTLDAFKFE